MSPSRRHTVFSSLLIVAALILVGEGFGVYFGHQAFVQADSQLKSKSKELMDRLTVSAASTDEMAFVIDEEVARMTQRVERLRTALSGGERGAQFLSEAVPMERRDAYFDLEAYVRRMREAARENHVSITVGERFGFATYVNEGPVKELIPQAFRQRQVLEYLLETLFAAQPQKLLTVYRSAPGGSNRSGTLVKDTFVIDPSLSVKAPGYIETEAYRISFIGETAVLRNWMTRLAKFEVPVIIRTVEVEPLEVAMRPTTDSSALAITSNSEAPIVGRLGSRFTVVVEYLKVVPISEGGAP